jgi:hypothetical protein
VRRRRSRLIAAIVVTAGSVVVSSTPADARGAAGGPASGVRFTLQAQPAWAPLGGESPLRLRVSGAPAGSEIAVVAHPAVISRSAYDRVQSGRDLGSVLGQVIRYPLDALPAGPNGDRVFPLGLQAATAPRDPNRLPIRRAGVYPLEVELRDANETRLTGFTTTLVAVDPSGLGATKKLQVAWVWPLVADPAIKPDGSPDARVVAEMQPEGRLGHQVALLARTNGTPVTIAPNPETLDAWSAFAALRTPLQTSLANLRASTVSNQVLSAPFVPLDTPSLIAGGFSAELDTELVQGNQTLDAVLATRLDARTARPGPLDDAALAKLRDSGIDRVIVEPASLTPTAPKLTQAQPFTLQAGDRTAVAVADDENLARLLTGTDPPALRAQRVLAGLAIVAEEQPAVQRGVVIVNPDRAALPDAVLTPVLDGLENHPLLAGTTVDKLFSTVPVENDSRKQPVVRDLSSRAPQLPPVSVSSYRDAQARQNAFRTLVGPSDPSVKVGDRALLVALSSVWRGAAGRAGARAELAGVNQTIDAFLAEIRVPVGNTITLTGREAAIPLTFLNQTNRTVHVRVRLTSDKLVFPDGSERELVLPPRNTTVRFKVGSRTSGTFTMALTVTSLDGGLVIKSTNVNVRSTFVSGVGIFLTAGAGVFLAGWWANDYRRRRRRRSMAAHAATGAAPAGGSA